MARGSGEFVVCGWLLIVVRWAF